MHMDFKSKLNKSWGASNSLLCVGLDPDISKLPKHLLKNKQPFFEFNKAIIEATADLVCAFKPNSAMYEALGANGIEQLRKTCEYIKRHYPDIPIILDYKRGDIGNTNEYYAKFAFDYLGVDAITIAPYMGRVANEPFLQYKNKGIIVLCRTSNPGAGEFQDLEVKGKKLYQVVAEEVMSNWNKNNNCLLVVGSPYPDELAAIRKALGDDAIFLVPGLGTQGGEVEATVKAGINSRGTGVIINSSREIIYSSKNKDFAVAARKKAQDLRDKINNSMGPGMVYRKELEKLGVVYSGHFVGVSTKHLSGYWNNDPLLPHVALVEKMTMELVAQFKNDRIDTVASPAVGAIPLAQFGAQRLAKLTGKDVLAVWADKVAGAKEREFIFEREGFAEAVKGKRVLLLEDIINQMASIKAMIKTVRAAGGNIVGVGALEVNRGVSAKALNVPKLVRLIDAFYDAWTAEDCAKDGLCAQGVPIVTDIGHGDDFQKKHPKYKGGYVKLLT